MILSSEIQMSLINDHLMVVKHSPVLEWKVGGMGGKGGLDK